MIMKKHTFLTIAITVLCTLQSIAQQDYLPGDAQDSTVQKHQLKGPAAKNYKPWNTTSSPSPITVTHPKTLKGPEAKNSKPWEQDLKVYSIVFVARKDLKGPKAKNHRPERSFEQTRSLGAKL